MRKLSRITKQLNTNIQTISFKKSERQASLITLIPAIKASESIKWPFSSKTWSTTCLY